MPTLSLPSTAIRKITCNTYNVSVDDEVLFVTPTQNANVFFANVTLFDSTSHNLTGRLVIIRNMDAGTRKIRVKTSHVGATIDGLTEYIVEPSQMVEFKSDGHDWWVVSNDDLTHQIEHTEVSNTCLIDWELGKNHVVGLVGNVVFDFSGAKSGGHYNLIIWQNGVGNNYYTFPEDKIAWSGNIEPDLVLDAGTVDFYAFYYDGDTYIGAGSLYVV